MKSSADRHIDGADGFVGFDVWDYEQWVTTRVDEHVDGIIEMLRNRPEAVAYRKARAQAQAAAASAAQARVTIDPQTGDMPAGLCWVCAGAQVQQATRCTPTFRACAACRVYDRHQARVLGLVMVLPLMDYPTQPVLPGHEFLTSPATEAALGRAWSQVSVLAGWRASIVRAVLARQAWPQGTPITMAEFERFLPAPLLRSRLAWWAYLDRHQPALASILDAGCQR